VVVKPYLPPNIWWPIIDPFNGNDVRPFFVSIVA
jgi:hypothetical protein